MSERTDADDRSVADAIDEALAVGWSKGEAGDFDPEEYTWGIVPCHHCGEAQILGAHDPDDTLETGERTFVVIPTGGPDE